MPAELPDIVTRARERALHAGFELSCEPGVGRLLATLAAAVPSGGRVLELGTGAGVGLAWLVNGLGERGDVELITVDVDASLQAKTEAAGWPRCVRFRLGDGATLVRELGRFDLIFADAPGGKLEGLDDTIAALAEHGVLLVDDMDLAQHDDPELERALTDVRERLLGHPELVASELDSSSGIIIATRRAPAS
jgi:demethylmenaquinone methyltransferase/2-methoxy-6-polyprenyl-1,4-benzoquinol methylase